MLEAGHVFLARMGKTMLRSGGIDTTQWLLSQTHINSHTNILEVACNMGTTMIKLAGKFGCRVTGIDLDENALAHARENIYSHNLQDKITLVHANAEKLPFPDNSFDVIINEAMLTMLTDKSKAKVLAEYHRVLKPGGMLLTHDVMFVTDDRSKQEELRIAMTRAINVRVEPHTASDWKDIFTRSGYDVIQNSGPMTLMTPSGMVHDEGLFRTLAIIFRALKPENRQMFMKMFSYFRKNKKYLGYVCNVSTRNEAA